MSRHMLAWIVTIEYGGKTTARTVEALTPTAAAKKAFGGMYGHHWEAFATQEDIPKWVHVRAIASSAKGSFHCGLVEHG